ncbi:hypothetical protein ABT346_30595 [Micromonospora peucetia]|uniref:hypothetical protein n=1 Tax=Micromonospora peucetia TaxID=47871 RepID=UPI00332C74E3
MKTGIELLSLEGHGERVRETADLLLWLKDHGDATPQDLVRVAPGWLIHAFVPERTAEENEAWLVQWQASSDPLAFERESGWTASNWIHWFSPDNEFWSVEEVRIDGGGSRLTVQLEHDNDPIPFEAVRWLALVAGLHVGDAFRTT